MRFKNIALTIALAGFALGFIDFQENILFWLGRPNGAVIFILYFISAFLEKFDSQDGTVAATQKSEVRAYGQQPAGSSRA
jgi:hypothetical protein